MDNKYFVNIDEIDNQHKRIFEISAELESVSMLNKDETKNLIPHLMKKLSDYTIYHFGYEEKIMEEKHYTKIREHISMHRSFVNKMFDISFEYNQKKQIDIVALSIFVKQWVNEHIGVHDKEFARFYHGKNSK